MRKLSEKMRASDANVCLEQKVARLGGGSSEKKKEKPRGPDTQRSFNPTAQQK
jgi:hypothetical protein